MDVVFTFKPKLTFTSSASELLIDDLVPGTAADSNVTNISISTSSTAGYSLYATVGSTDNASTNLVKASSSNTFTNLSTNAATLNDIADNTWGYTYSTDSGSTWKSGNTGSTNTGYNGLPIYTAASGVLLADASTNSQTDLQFKVGAKAGEDQPAGAYTNDITFNAVAKLLTTNYTITYNDPSSEATNMPAAYTGVASNGIFFLTDTTPSRTDYTFDGWCSVAPTNDNECSGTTYSPGSVYTLASVSSTQSITVYAIWKSETTTLTLDDIENMQEMTPEICASSEVNDTAALKDTRDNKYYYVTKLADGNCWMTQNLDFDIPASGLTSADSDVTSSWDSGSTYAPTATSSTISSSSSNTGTLSWNLGDYAYDGTTNSTCGTDATSYADCTSYGFSTTSSTTVSANHYHVGNLYQYNAATAGTGGTIASAEATDSICPKGWRLPTGNTGGEFQLLSNAYGATSGTSTSGTVQNLLDSPLYFVRGGNVGSGALRNAGFGGGYWSSTAYSSTSSAYGLYFGGSSSIGPSTYDSRYYGQSVRCIAHITATQPTITYNNNGGTGTIASQTAASASEYAQSFTLSDGAGVSRNGYVLLGWSTNSSATTAEYTLGQTISAASDLDLYAVWEEATYMQDFSCSSLASGATTTLVDSRDNEEYLVGKLADGNCWMLDNLRLGGSSSIVLTYLDTNIDMYGVRSYTLPASGTVCFSSDSCTGTSGATGTGYTVSAINADYKNTTTTSYGSGSGKIGVYYNYCAASAGTICTSDNSSNDNYDICPRGWRMPTGGGGEYNTLYTAYGSDASSFRAALSITLSGVYYDGSAAEQGDVGIFWTPDYYPSNYRRILYVVGSSDDDSDSDYGYSNRFIGHSIRCISSN